MDPLAAAIKFLQTVWTIILLALLGYGFLLFWLKAPASAPPDSTVVFTLALAGMESAVVLYVRFSYIGRTAEMLRQSRSAPAARQKLTKGYFICFASSLGIALFGLVVRFLGAPLRWAMLFYGAGVALFLVSKPAAPAEN